MDYQNTNVRLLFGDCLQRMDDLGDNTVDLILTDLPYGTTSCEWDQIIPFEPMWKQYLRVLKEDGVIVLTAAQPFTSKLVMSQPNLFRHIWYWEKEKGTNFLRTGSQPLRVIEEVCVFSKSGTYTYQPQMVPLDKPYTHTMPLRHSPITGEGDINPTVDGEREYKTYTHAHPKNLIRFARDKNVLVPTQKPVSLMTYLVRTYSQKGDVVLDSCLGSGTTGVACATEDRRFIGIEANPKHFQISKTRIEAIVEGKKLKPTGTQVLLNCEICSAGFIVKRYRAATARFCSKKCGGAWHMSNRQMPNDHKIGNQWRKGVRPTNAFTSEQSKAINTKEPLELECHHCTKKFHVTPWLANNNSKERKYCTHDCYLDHVETIKGEKHPLWVGGRTTYRGKSWPKARAAAAERDKGICQSCDKEVGPSIPVHHIKPYRLFENDGGANQLDNLICLCQSCHIKIERGSMELPRKD